MDQIKAEGYPTTQGMDREERPLGRGLEDISRLFLSTKTNDGGAADAPPGRPPERTPSPTGSHARTVLLRPCAAVSRGALGAMVRELQGALEEGLQVIDAAIPCYPTGEIDLLAVDRANQLTIIDFDA